MMRSNGVERRPSSSTRRVPHAVFARALTAHGAGISDDAVMQSARRLVDEDFTTPSVVPAKRGPIFQLDAVRWVPAFAGRHPRFDCLNGEPTAPARRNARSCQVRYLGFRSRQHSIPSHQALGAGGRRNPRLHRELPQGSQGGGVSRLRRTIQRYTTANLDARAE